jgi:O-antigen ligase
MAMMLSIVWTLSRSGIAAMAIAGTLFALHATTRLRRRGSLGPIAGTWFVLMALVVAVVWRGAGDVAAWYGRTNTMEWRIEQWHDTWPIVRDFRWFGTGLNTYAASLLVYPTSHPEVRVIEAHNDYLQVLSEGGVVITVAGLVAVLLLMRGIRRAFAAPQGADVYWVRVGAVLGIMAIGLQEILDFSLQMPGNAVLFTVLIAIALHRASPSSVGRVPQWD